jgi:hypothetical protein
VLLQDVDILVETTILSMLCPDREVAGVTIMEQWVVGYLGIEALGFRKQS